ncbi:MAG: hypothetical protein MUF49_32170 [Oculatellaceae cyanobacterium Prado106]|nr:hypothetical protein [Oculatellaceae cyanobacterium Prado106]
MQTAPPITAQQAQAIANQLLSDHLGDRFMADFADRTSTENQWRVPIILAYPTLGSLGEVGEIWVSTLTETVVAHTPFEDMESAARTLYHLHQHDIEAPVQ